MRRRLSLNLIVRFDGAREQRRSRRRLPRSWGPTVPPLLIEEEQGVMTSSPLNTQ
jgi:hypothetical protein